MWKPFGKDHISRAERKRMEERIACALLEDLIYDIHTEDVMRLGFKPDQAMIRYMGLREIKWIPQTGNVICVFQDGAESTWHTNMGLVLFSQEGEIAFNCRPLNTLDDSRMDRPASGQT